MCAGKDEVVRQIRGNLCSSIVPGSQPQGISLFSFTIALGQMPDQSPDFTYPFWDMFMDLLARLHSGCVTLNLSLDRELLWMGHLYLAKQQLPLAVGVTVVAAWGGASTIISYVPSFLYVLMQFVLKQLLQLVLDLPCPCCKCVSPVLLQLALRCIACCVLLWVLLIL